MIDILLATYNGAENLGAQLDSILRQTYTNWNLLIRDDGSTDNTLKLIKSYISKYPTKIHLCLDGNQNLGVTLNFSRLTEYSDAEYIMFCDQDDIWLPDKIEKTMMHMHELEKEHLKHTPALVFSDLEVVDERLNTISSSLWEYQKLDPNIALSLDKILAQNVVTGCSIMINKAAKEICFPILTDQVLHDHWMAINVCKYGVNSYIKEPLLRYRQHQSNELGAVRVNRVYFIRKLIEIIKDLDIYMTKYKYLSFKVSVPKLVFWKVYLNIKRLI